MCDVLPWMEEILHQLIGGLSNHLQSIYMGSTIQSGVGFLPSTVGVISIKFAAPVLETRYRLRKKGIGKRNIETSHRAHPNFMWIISWISIVLWEKYDMGL